MQNMMIGTMTYAEHHTKGRSNDVRFFGREQKVLFVRSEHARVVSTLERSFPFRSIGEGKKKNGRGGGRERERRERE